MGSRGKQKPEVAEAAACTHGGLCLSICIVYCSAVLRKIFYHKPQISRAERDLGDQGVQPPHFPNEEPEMWAEKGRKKIIALIERLSFALDAWFQVPQLASGRAQTTQYLDEHIHPTQAFAWY